MKRTDESQAASARKKRGDALATPLVLERIQRLSSLRYFAISREETLIVLVSLSSVPLITT